MKALTLADRRDAHAAAFPEYPASHLWMVEEDGSPVLYGRWLIGSTYGNETGYYGAHPRGYLKRVGALFPDLLAETADPVEFAFLENVRFGASSLPEAKPRVLHVFSGSLPPGPYWRLDVNPMPLYNTAPDIAGSVYDLGTAITFTAPMRLVFADPPYSQEDAEHYAVPMVDRLRATDAIARVTAPGGFLVWLDVCWPMFRRELWRTVGRIALTRSTNHRLRDITIFERGAA